ncbi:MAG: leucine-rich repeat domain-containing protein, partial [Oscillospiraceae bacterium]|nr:leucine-rich repeat domain-containing protein [Oscillospiraceae bacterium]
MKKNALAMLCTALVLSANSVTIMPAFAEDVKSGEWYQLNWTLENHVLTVSGNDAIHMNGFPEWSEYKDDIYEIVLNEGVTGAEGHVLADYPNLEKITLPSTFTKLGNYALSDNPNLTKINGLEYVETFNQHC